MTPSHAKREGSRENPPQPPFREALFKVKGTRSGAVVHAAKGFTRA